MGWPPAIHVPAASGAFPPEQTQQLPEPLRQPPPPLPPQSDPPPTRWSLQDLQQGCPWLQPYTLSGIWPLLQALDMRYTPGRHHLSRPDPAYERKWDFAHGCVDRARQRSPRCVPRSLEAMSDYRPPTLARAWGPRGADQQPLAELSYRRHTRRRIVGALDVVTGAVHGAQGAQIGGKQLAAFYGQLRAAYPKAKPLDVIQDPWPIPCHPTVQEAAKPPRIQRVALPTDAPWLHPIEKLWRKMKQEVCPLHRVSDEWETLQQRVTTLLQPFAEGALALLRYVGLLPKLLPD